MRKNVKLVVLDIDGTILDDRGDYSNKLAIKLKELISKGIQVVFATGRAYISAKTVMKKMGLNVPIIAHNGSRIMVPGVGELHNKKMPLADARTILRHGDLGDFYTTAYIDDVMYIKEADKFSMDFIHDNGIDHKIVGPLGENVQDDVNIILFIYPEPVEKDYAHIFRDLDISITRSMPQAFEFMARGCNKGSALEIVADHLGVKQGNILAVGNALNDLEMLGFAGTGIAMKNSDPNLLEVWDNLSEYTNNEDGVYEIIKHI